MTRCANATGAGQRSFCAGSCAQRVMPEPMTASHLHPQFSCFISNVSEVQR
jgi:hypothetical protein